MKRGPPTEPEPDSLGIFVICDFFFWHFFPFQAGCGRHGNKVLPRGLMFAVKEIGSVFHGDASARVRQPDADFLMSWKQWLATAAALRWTHSISPVVCVCVW